MLTAVSEEESNSMSRLPKHRHIAGGGYPRGEETRARIVAAALKLFGERGFEGASTRDIAKAAGVNAPALQYYFDSKEGVYFACVEHIVARVWEQMSAAIGSAERAVARESTDSALIEAFCAIQEQFAEFLITPQDTNDWRLFMARQQAGMGPAAGFQIVYQRFSKRIFSVTGTIVGRLLGRPADDIETLIRATALLGQMMVFQVSRRTALALLDWEEIDAERLAIIKRIIREHTVALLRAMIAARPAKASYRRTPGSPPRSRRRPPRKRGR
jgi:TetR/AcrR family transcriptional regulator, regulator of cefoperazone and chloramphenicol sensitivity